jgi:integrase
MLRAALKKAHAWKKLLEPATVKLLKQEQGKTRFLSEEEETAILAACSPALRRIVQAGLLTGFQRQELTSLRPEDVDFVRGTVSVAACFSKNGESRTLPMSPRLRAVLEDALAVRGDAPTVFTTRQRKPRSPIGFTQMLKYTCVRAGMEPLSPHVLRHTFASCLVMAGVDLRTVQELMGHKSIAMTMRYAHLSPDHKRAAIEALESRFPGKSPANFHNTPTEALPIKSAKIVAIH